MSLECGQYLIAKECNVIQTMQDSVAAFRRTISAATVGELSFPTSLDASRRGPFLALAAKAMRCVLVDHFRIV